LIRRFLALSAAERGATCEAAVLLALLAAGLRVAPRSFSGALLRRACASEPGQVPVLATGLVVRAVERAGARLPGVSCLAQAMAGWTMLRRRAIPARVRIGVRRAGASVRAHAWLEHAGAIVLGAESAAEHIGFPPPP
jgi:hypothetical protein